MRNSDQEYIIHYYFAKLARYAAQVKKDFSGKSIHLFRVDFKKLRAFLRLLSSATPAPGQLKFPHKFKKMYSLMGKIRDRQLCLKRIKESENAREGRQSNKTHLLKKDVKELTARRNAFLTKREFKEIEKSIIELLPGIPADTLVKNFFHQKLQVISEIAVRGDYKDGELHDIRKSIKDIIYITRIFRDDLKTKIPFVFWNQDQLKKVEGLSHKLGLFNDACIALSLLQPANIEPDAIEKERLKAIRQTWFLEKRRLKKEILDELRAKNSELTILN